jgi:hypothetical protein
MLRHLRSCLLVAVCALAPVLAEVYSPTDNITVHYWTGAEAKGFVYPEQSKGPFGIKALLAKPDFGVAVSGGGYRATTVGLGCSIGLHQVRHAHHVGPRCQPAHWGWRNPHPCSGVRSRERIPLGAHTHTTPSAAQCTQPHSEYRGLCYCRRASCSRRGTCPPTAAAPGSTALSPTLR